MNKTVKTSEVLNVYQIISSAKYGKMSDDDKIKAWKLTRKLKPIATKFDDDSKDAAEKMKPEVKGGFDDVLAKAQEYERLKQEKQPTIDIMTDAQYKEFIEKFKEYQKLIDKAVKEFAEKKVTVDFEPLSEEAFGKLLASNDWNMGQVTVLGEFVCEG